MKKIIVNTPDITYPAGVANHYLGLEEHFSESVVYNQYKTRACLERDYAEFPGFIRFFLRVLLKIKDVLNFLILIVRYNKPVILLNPSLGASALRRDSFFYG